MPAPISRLRACGTAMLVPLVVAACDNPVPSRAAGPGPISAAVVVQQHMLDVPGVLSNDCTGELFSTQGTVLLLISLTDDGAGGFHANFHLDFINFTFTNTATGEAFRTNQAFNETSQDTRGGVLDNAELTFMLAGPGGRTVTNEVFHLRFQFVVNADGTVTVSNFEIRISCT